VWNILQIGSEKMLKLVVLSISVMLLSPPVINGILPEIRDSLGITQAQSELITTIPSIASLIVILLSSVIVKRVGMKKMIVAGLILVGIGGVLPVFANDFTVVLIGRTILGMGLGLYSPLAIDLINILFDEKERATLMGYRSAIEQLGQSMMSMAVGVLALLSWNLSFLVYAIALVLAIAFFALVPELDSPNGSGNDVALYAKSKMTPLVYPIILIAIIVVLNGAAIGIRFPALAAEIMGDGYNSSVFFFLKPMIGICAGFFFGRLHQALGRKLLYIGLACLGTASLLVGFSNGNFIVLAAGFLLSSLVPAWIFPFIFMMISKKTDGSARKFAMSLVLVALNATVFLMTPIVGLIERIVGSTALAAPYPVIGGLVFVALISVVLFGGKMVEKY